jgi:putative peptidoglycan lipid II flippase
MAGGALVEQSWAATLSSSSVAAYSFGTRFTTVAAGVLVSTLSAILLPHFSELRATVPPDRLRRAVLRVASTVLFASVPVAVLLAVAAEPLTAALYERGQFTAADTRIVAGIQSVHALYVPVFALGMVAVRLLNAVGASRTLLVGAVISMSSSFLLNAMLAPTLGVVGIAWANVFMYSLSVGYLWYRTLAFLGDCPRHDS